ncbi:hypothetical protein CMK11_12260, partial [Candidatus Poribacteria bacterium]|nr:hypothetical protein [Candidatus Poribacteria bacterium]
QNLTLNAGFKDEEPAWSPDGAQIAFESERDGNNEIFVMQADGASPTQLTVTDVGSQDLPSWAPDGSQIAFRSTRDGNGEIYIMNADGANQTRITFDGADAFAPSWSPYLPPSPHITVSPTTLDLGSVAVGSPSSARFVITNVGTIPLSVSGLAATNVDFVVAPVTRAIPFDLPENEGEVVTVTFTPITEGSQVADITISHDAEGGSSMVSVSGTGVAPGNPTMVITSPTAGQTLPPGTASVNLTVDIQSHAAPGHWHWQLDTPFPATGLAGGNEVAEGVAAATITGLTDGVSYTAYATLVDESHNVLSPAVEASVSFSVEGSATDFVRAVSVQAGAGTTVSVPIEAYDISAAGVVGVAISLTYDDALLTPTADAVTLGAIVPAGWTLEQNVVAAGQLNFSMAADFASALPSGGTLAQVAFDVVAGAVAGTTSPLTLASVQLNEGGVPSTPVSGTFTVLNLVYGDVTGNGAAGAYDAAWVLEHVVNGLLGEPVDVAFPIETTAPVWASFPLTPAEADQVADVDGDASVGSPDASLILQREVGIIAAFPVEGAAAPSATVNAPAALLRGSGAQARPGGRIVVRVHSDGARNVSSAQLRLDYDPGLLRLVDVSLGGDSWQATLARAERPGEVAIAFAAARPAGDSAPLVAAAFETNPTLARRARGVIRAARLRLGAATAETTLDYAFTIEPYRTRLMANYPNPFKAETWIPFELGADADVTVHICDLAGRRVRVLDIGRRPMGEHITRAAAAYWDGANELGEGVVSGVYVYELAAGEHRSMRRMIVLK